MEKRYERNGLHSAAHLSRRRRWQLSSSSPRLAAAYLVRRRQWQTSDAVSVPSSQTISTQPNAAEIETGPRRSKRATKGQHSRWTPERPTSAGSSQLVTQEEAVGRSPTRAAKESRRTTKATTSKRATAPEKTVSASSAGSSQPEAHDDADGRSHTDHKSNPLENVGPYEKEPFGTGLTPDRHRVHRRDTVVPCQVLDGVELLGG